MPVTDADTDIWKIKIADTDADTDIEIFVTADTDSKYFSNVDTDMDADPTIYYFKQYFFIETKVLMKKSIFLDE